MTLSDLHRALFTAARECPPGERLAPRDPRYARLRALGEAIAAEGGMAALQDAIRAADPNRDGHVGRTVNRVWHGIDSWLG